ncbi:MAG: hypothetical protein A2287_04700 [Candidatus Melainabacteria bacterium RIFOXYA12_FULL_32_12]|nr:MAG: hypothetical protein A2287_04700 [Candidatus Melainabacteria bacterium RIFOXYA12_FULL_32_12]
MITEISRRIAQIQINLSAIKDGCKTITNKDMQAFLKEILSNSINIAKLAITLSDDMDCYSDKQTQDVLSALLVSNKKEK